MLKKQRNGRRDFCSFHRFTKKVQFTLKHFDPLLNSHQAERLFTAGVVRMKTFTIIADLHLQSVQ